MNPREKQPNRQRDTLVFIAIAVVLMIIADQWVFGGKRGYIEKIREEHHQAQSLQAERPDSGHVQEMEPAAGGEAIPLPTGDYLHENAVQPKEESRVEEPVFPYHEAAEGAVAVAPPAESAPAAEEEPPAQPQAEASAPAAEGEEPAITLASLPPVTAPGATGAPKIAIIIDDVGMNIKNSRAVIGLPGEVTLAFLPYAPQTPALAEEALKSGHEAMIHVPMEAEGSNEGLGPMALKSGMSAEEMDAMLDRMFDSFIGYSGINNHMGSRLTQDREAMARVMQALKRRALYFVDSKTIGSSAGASEAHRAGVPFAARDVFLDHEDTAAFVAHALEQTERIARQNGSAIAIGHPKDATIEGLRAWLPTLKDKGFDLVPASALVRRPVPTRPADAVSAAPAPQPLPQIE